MNIRYATAECALGRLLVAATGRGVCFVGVGDSDEALEAALREAVPAAGAPVAIVRSDDEDLHAWSGLLVRYCRGDERNLDAVPLDMLGGSPFQRQVWEALRAIPYGETRSYKEVAQAVGRPAAVRAVGGACGANPIALITPCHRVVRSDGMPGGYGGGVERKRALLTMEHPTK